MDESRKADLNLALQQFFKIVYVDFGIRTKNNRLNQWYQLSWDEFKEELEKEKVKLTRSLHDDWKDFFHRHKQKVISLMS